MKKSKISFLIKIIFICVFSVTVIMTIYNVVMCCIAASGENDADLGTIIATAFIMLLFYIFLPVAELDLFFFARYLMSGKKTALKTMLNCLCAVCSVVMIAFSSVLWVAAASDKFVSLMSVGGIYLILRMSYIAVSKICV